MVPSFHTNNSSPQEPSHRAPPFVWDLQHQGRQRHQPRKHILTSRLRSPHKVTTTTVCSTTTPYITAGIDISTTTKTSVAFAAAAPHNRGIHPLEVRSSSRLQRITGRPQIAVVAQALNCSTFPSNLGLSCLSLQASFPQQPAARSLPPCGPSCVPPSLVGLLQSFHSVCPPPCQHPRPQRTVHLLMGGCLQPSLRQQLVAFARRP